MSEKKIVVDDMRIEYQGLLNVRELFKVIDDWLRDNGYDKKEALNSEIVKHESKFLEIKYRPWKTLSDYAKITIKLNVNMSNLKDVEIKKDGHKLHMSQGKVTFIFQGAVDTDYEGRWESRPTLFLIRTLFDKYVYRSYSTKYDSEISRDINTLAAEIRKYLNLQKQY